MSIGLAGRKCGMSRLFTEDGRSIPVTLIEATPNRVTQFIESLLGAVLFPNEKSTLLLVDVKHADCSSPDRFERKHRGNISGNMPKHGAIVRAHTYMVSTEGDVNDARAGVGRLDDGDLFGKRLMAFYTHSRPNSHNCSTALWT